MSNALSFISVESHLECLDILDGCLSVPQSIEATDSVSIFIEIKSLISSLLSPIAYYGQERFKTLIFGATA